MNESLFSNFFSGKVFHISAKVKTKIKDTWFMFKMYLTESKNTLFYLNLFFKDHHL